MSLQKPILASALTLIGAWFVLNASAQRPPTTGNIAAAADKFVATLDEAQRGKLIFDFKDQAQRQRWSNLPVSPNVPRLGLRMGDLTPPQREAAMGVLVAALSPQGYQKVIEIVEADEVLRIEGCGRGRGPDARGGAPAAGGPTTRGAADARGGPEGRRGRGGGGGGNFGRDIFFISFIGQPSATEPWIIQFGGHHLGINISLAGEQGSLSPSLTAAQPATYQLEGKTIRPLGREVEKSFALLSSLDEAQRKQAILGFEMRNLALGPGRDGQTIAPEGIKGSALTEKQREMLLDLASEWTGILNDSAAAAKMEEMKKNIADTHFAWSGPTEKDSPAYFRIQGPTVHIEYAPQGAGAGALNHIHTIYRDPTNEYGAKWSKP